MANVKFDKELFEKEIGKLDEALKEKISLFGTPLESITDEDIELEIFPNRPDLLSYQGFKRAFLSWTGKKTGLIEYKTKKPEKNFQVIVEKSVEKIWPYVSCAIVKGLNLDDKKIKEIINIQEKLTFTLGRKRGKFGLGVYPLDEIKLPITYKALEPDKIRFVPLEFPREINGLEILQKHPTGREYSHLLSGKEKFPIFVDSENNILSMPPIINSEKTGRVTEKTKDLFIECTGLDKNVIEKSINILVTSLAEMGGQIYQMEIISKNKELVPNLKTQKIKISQENVNKLLGLNLTEKEIKQLLEKMGYSVNKNSVEVPSWRVDILHEVDLIEDIAIAYGYDKLIPEIPTISSVGEENKTERIKKKIAEILCGLGLIEVSNYHLTTKNDQILKVDPNDKKVVEIKESKTDYSLLRKDLSHYQLKNLSENIDSEYPQKTFEMGKIFKKEDKIVETENLAISLTPGNYTEIKQVASYLFRMLNLELEIVEPEEIPKYFIEGRTAELKINKKSIGFLGEVHPKILKNWKIKMPVSLLEINLEEIFNQI